MKKRGKKNIYSLGISSLFNDIGSEMIAPILPFYIMALGGGGFAIGALSGIREGLASIFKILGGWISDRVGKRKKFVFFGYFISVISRLVLAFVNAWQSVIGIVGLDRVGKLRDAPRDAIIIDSTSKRGKGFGLHQMLDTVGAVIGTILVIILFWFLDMGFKQIIVWAAILSSLALVPLFFVKEYKFKKTKTTLFKGIKLLNPKLKYFVLVASVFALANFGLYMFLIVLAKETFGNNLVPLILYAVFNIVYAGLVMRFGTLSDRIGRKKILFAGYALFFLLSVFLVFFVSKIFVIVSFVLYGMVYALTNSNQRALASDFIKTKKGTGMGFFNSVSGIGKILGGVIGGLLWDVSHILMFGYLAFISLISIVLLFFVREK